MSEKTEPMELLRFPFNQSITYHYSAGPYGSRFFSELKNKKFYGTKCPKCSDVYLPPRIVCPVCHKKMEEWVEVGPKATLMGGTTINHSFPDPMTGKIRQAPYGIGFIRLDGCATRIMHFLEESDIDKVRLHMRLEPVFAEERHGDFNDILFFRTIEE